MPGTGYEALIDKPYFLPDVVDDLAIENAEGLWVEYPPSESTYDAGFSTINYAQFANAVNGVAHFIRNSLGRKGDNEPLAWLGPNDPRCAIAMIAAIKTGFTLFFLSERNSAIANHKLLDDAKCSVLVTTDPEHAAVPNTLSNKVLTLLELPPLEQLIYQRQPYYPFDTEFESVRFETALMIHTSGSTGLPKPVWISHECMSRIARNMTLCSPEGFDTMYSILKNKRGILLLPLSHPAGITLGILNPIFNKSTVILPLSTRPPTGESLVQILQHTQAHWAGVAPLTLELISKDNGLLEELSNHLETFVFSGGSLPKVFGDVIASRFKLMSAFGSSETGPVATMYPHGLDFRKDWNFLQYHPAVGTAFSPVLENVHELVFKRTSEAEPYQAPFTHHPGLSEYRTNDLFSPHATIPDMWTHVCRADDVIVFITGEKVNPVAFESHISQLPDVRSALMFGDQRFEAGLLIELNDRKQRTASETLNTIRHFWPTIKRANTLLPAHAQVSLDHICLAEPDMPILRTSKDTIRRHLTLELYKDKIDKVYTDAEKAWENASSPLPFECIQDLENIIRKSLNEISQLGIIDRNDDFFHKGMDSLQVLRLVRQLRIHTASYGIQPSAVYSNPSIARLTDGVHRLVSDIQDTANTKQKQRALTIMATMEKHIQDIDRLASAPCHLCDSKPVIQDGHVVLLTGSTGTIGSYILNALLQHPYIGHIYCLNRSQDSLNVQKERNARYDPTLPTTFSKERVTFLKADLTERRTLGLSQHMLDVLLSNVTLIIHNAWTVDFNIPLNSFKPQLAGVVNLSSFCANAQRRPSFVFISSISAVIRFILTESGKKTVPEDIINDVEVAAETSYGESKYIGGRLIAHAAERLNLSNARILRLGQIAGAAHTPGRWNPSDWVPAMIKSSQHLGVLPGSLSSTEGSESYADIDWMPVDVIAAVIVEIGLKAAKTPVTGGSVQVLQPLNPRLTSWAALLPGVLSSMQSVLTASETALHGTIEVVSPAFWLEKLRCSARASMDSNSSDESREALLRANPAIRLLEFFEMQFGGSHNCKPEELLWETGNAQRESEVLANAPAIDGPMMKRWIVQWLSLQYD